MKVIAIINAVVAIMVVNTMKRIESDFSAPRGLTRFRLPGASGC